MVQQREVMYESPEAAREVMVYAEGKHIATGWLSIDNVFFTDESIARYRSHTHRLCECGNKMERGYTSCKSCIHEKRRLRYMSLPEKEWDGKSAICIYGDDQYFFSEEELDEYCEEQGVNKKDMMLVHCQANYYSQINDGYWEDVLPIDGEIHSELAKRLDEINKFIKTLPPVSYSEDKIRVKW